MINTKAYSEAAAEVIDIIQHMDEEIIELIPLDMIKNLNAKKSKEYIPNIDYSNDEIKNIKPETKALLAVIYRDYICTPEEREEFNKLLIKNQNELNEKYKVDFENNKIDSYSNNSLPAEIEESFWKKIMNKLFKNKVFK